MNPGELTTRQREVYEFLREFHAETGYPPSLREIARHIGWSSHQAAVQVLKTLQEKGLVERDIRGHYRALDTLSASPQSLLRVSSVHKIPDQPIRQFQVADSRKNWLSTLARRFLYENSRTIELASGVEIDELALRAGFRVEKRVLHDSVAGQILLDEKRIIVNSRHSLARQRFTIAHELGHSLLRHKPRVGHFLDCQSDSAQEQEANLFAAYLLMPLSHLRGFIEQVLPPSERRLAKGDAVRERWLVRKVAAQFRVSLAAARIRLAKLGYITASEEG